VNLRRVSGLLSIVVFPLLVSCAATMSLDEAKKVTVAAPRQSFVPPPRKADDIYALLNKKQIYQSKSTEDYLKKAAMPIPAGADDSKLKIFYETRGMAFYHLGRYMEALADLRKAYVYFQTAKGRRNVLVINLSFLEAEVGNFKAAVNILEDEIPQNMYPWGAYSHLTRIYARTGDIESARRMNSRCREVCDEFRQRNPRAVERNRHCEAALNRSDGFVLQAEGKFEQAEVHLRKFADYGASMLDTEPHHAVGMRISLIVNLIQQGKLLEAEVEARKALDQSLDLMGSDSVLTGKILIQFVNILRRQDRLEEADIISNETLRILEVSGISPDSDVVCSARNARGNLLFARGRYGEAMKIYDRAKGDMRDNQLLYERFFTRNLNMIVSLVKAGRSGEALPLASAALEKNRRMYGAESYAAAEALGIRAMAQSSLKNHEAAWRDFSSALPSLRRRNLGQMTNPDRKNRVILIYESYLDFLSAVRGTKLAARLGINADAVSYQVMSLLTGHSLSVAVGETTARAAAAYDPELADLVRKEQDAQKEITVLRENIADILVAPEDDQAARGLKESQARIDALTRARTSLGEEIKKRFPKYADYINPPLPTVELTQRNLRPREALLAVYTADDRTFIWAVPKSGPAAFAVSPMGRKDLTLRVEQLRRSLDSRPTVLGDIPDYDLAAAYDLYRRIFKPVEGALASATDILAIVRGPLSQLPLAVLPASPPSRASDGNLLFSRYRKTDWLIRKVSVTMLPSVSALVTLRSLPAGDPARKAFAGFGDPVFNAAQLAASGAREARRKTQLSSRGAKLRIRGVRVTGKGYIDSKQPNSLTLVDLNRLPDTAAEIADIAKALNADPGRDTFLGKGASERNVKTSDLSDRRVVAFATHALVPGDLDGLEEPALALSAPSVTGSPEDGLLTMGEIMTLRLNADWVVLSACNTGASEGGGGEALTGLGRAFFYAGTRSVLASMWPVETTSARRLVADIFKYQQADAGLSRARALNKAMTGLIDDAVFIDGATGKVAASYAHPLFWAPFVMAGDPGK
jgi:CHAT domain-containing protein